MSKGLEALERLNIDFKFYENGVDEDRNKEDFEIIKQELKEKDKIIKKLFELFDISLIKDKATGTHYIYIGKNKEAMIIDEETYELFKEGKLNDD